MKYHAVVIKKGLYIYINNKRFYYWNKACLYEWIWCNPIVKIIYTCIQRRMSSLELKNSLVPLWSMHHATLQLACNSITLTPVTAEPYPAVGRSWWGCGVKGTAFPHTCWQCLALLLQSSSQPIGNTDHHFRARPIPVCPSLRDEVSRSVCILSGSWRPQQKV